MIYEKYYILISRKTLLIRQKKIKKELIIRINNKIIDYYYQRFGQSTSGEFGTVFNVGSPGSPTTAGYDPKAGYTRTQIQFHAFPIKSQLDKMKSIVD